jgi:DNA adenine methylase
LITYDDSPEIRMNFSFANIYEWELQYGMNNYKQGKAEKGSELFITNYDVPKLSQKKNVENSEPEQLSLL